MNGMQPPSPCNKWSQLSDVLPTEQREQLAQLILARLAAGWGSIEIVFRDFHIKEFREVHTIPSIKPANSAIIGP